MKIETKFDINQEIYFVINRVIDKKGFIKYGVFKGKIVRIEVNLLVVGDSMGLIQKYFVYSNGEIIELGVTELYLTREEAEAKLKELVSL